MQITHGEEFVSVTLLLADVSENFRNMCLKIYELDPTCFLELCFIELSQNFCDWLSEPIKNLLKRET